MTDAGKLHVGSSSAKWLVDGSAQVVTNGQISHHLPHQVQWLAI